MTTSRTAKKRDRSGRAGRTPALGVIAITLCLSLACAGSKQTVVVWKKAGASAEELDRARAECDAEIGDARGKSVRRDRAEAETMGGAFVQCMEGRGWKWETRQVEN